MRKLIYLCPFLILVGCATLSEDECRGGDWYEIGREDGEAGRKANFISEHAKACNEFGIAPKAGPWREGREVGLRSYCTPSNAYDVGAKGRRLSPVCPAAIQARLERSHDRGKRWYDIGREIDEIEREIAAINSKLRELPADDPSRSSLVSERSFLRLDLLGLRAERSRYAR